MTGIDRPTVVRPDGQAENRERWPGREHRPVKEQEEFHGDFEALGVAGEPIDERYEIEVLLL